MATTINPLSEGQEQSGALPSFMRHTLILNWEITLILVIFLLTLFTRFYNLGDRIMSHDESLHVQYSYDLYLQGRFEHTPLMHGPILFHMTALFYYLFGDNDFSARIYAALVGTLIVMSPLLFRRWLGRWGVLLAMIMLMISPLMMYYSRYIREDMPAILSSILMVFPIFMYLSGPENQRRRAHWLYMLSAAMLWNLGSKETAFMYIAIFGAFLTLYWLVRLAQYFYGVRGELLFATLVMSILLAGVASLGMIVVMSIGLGNTMLIGESLGARLNFVGEQFGLMVRGETITTDFAAFLSWTLLLGVVMAAIAVGPALWAYRSRKLDFSMQDLVAVTVSVLSFWVIANLVTVAVGFIISISIALIYAAVRLEGRRTFSRELRLIFAVAIVVFLALMLFEELSQVPARADETAAPVVPDQQGNVAVSETEFTLLPIVLVWILGAVVILALLYVRTSGWWTVLDQFPELDILIVMGSLVLPWLTAIFIVATRGTPADYVNVANDLPEWFRNIVPTGPVNPVQELERIGRVVIGFLAFIPMMAVAIVAGLTWNWRRWLVCSAIFHILFVFFFTTIFTNIQGLASGMVYSLQYWLEQQEVKRGSQPQYYYLLIILPFYEFLPIIGSVLAMVAGMILFWRRRRVADREDFPLKHDEIQNSLEDTNPDLEAPAAAQSTDFMGDPVFDTREHGQSTWTLTQVPFLPFVAWWAVFNLLAYTLAGEKMPWLGTHMTVPMIFLSAWYFGRIFDRIDLRQLMNRGWLLLILLPLLYVAVFQIIAPYLGGRPPFQGVERIQLTWTYNWLAAAAVAVGTTYIVFRLVEYTGWTHLRHMIALTTLVVLGIVTFRSAWIASFINYDRATEFLVYAHGGPGNRIVYEQLVELSLRTTGDMTIRFASDDGMAWPGSWYFRRFPNHDYYGSNPTLQRLESAAVVVVRGDGRAEVEPLLEDRYMRFDYIRMWWPIQDYFDLNAQRMNNLLDLSPNNFYAGQVRRGIFDIWWLRDYSQYAQAIGRVDGFSLDRWPVSDTVHFYVRKDIYAQIWPYGVGGGTPLVTEPAEVNVCAANWEPTPARVVFDTAAPRLLRPIGLAVGTDGLIYVAEEGNHRISVFTPDGQYLNSFGQQGTSAQPGAYFERPNGLEFAPDGALYVADTWNYLIRVFTPEREFITQWGEPFSAGLGAPQVPFAGFWGPRDVAIDMEGRVYVADTGNKRVRVYSAEGVYLHDIGAGGSGPGQLDEPVGLAIHPDGRLFVADTWNRRVSVFTLDGIFLAENSFRVRGWEDEPNNRPYLALDPVRDLLYVTDPDVGRILVYDTAGNCLGSFGQYNADRPDSSQFTAIGGIALDAEGNVYISDVATGRILRFDPFVRRVAPESSQEGAPAEGGSPGDVSEDTVEVTIEVVQEQEATAEATPEATEQAEPSG